MQKIYDVFISHSWNDSELAIQIYKQLTDAGFSCCYDKKSFHGAADFPKEIAESIINSKVFLYLASKNSYTSGWAPDEVAFAKRHKRRETLLFYAIDDNKMPEWMELAFAAVNRRNYKEHPVDTILVDDIRQILEGSLPLSPIAKKKWYNTFLWGTTMFLLVSILAYLIYWQKDQKPSLSISHEQIDSIQNYDEVKVVDLALSSGTLWADRNVGASNFTEYGEYFGWGDLTPQTEQSVYSFPNLNQVSLLDSEYDIARIRLGEGWSIPTPKQWKELYQECSWNWTNIAGVCGYKVSSTKNKSFIFIPASGRLVSKQTNVNKLIEVGNAGYYWTSYLEEESRSQIKAHLINFLPNKVDINASGIVETGRSVRAVKNR